jgi:hypothetical protein
MSTGSSSNLIQAARLLSLEWDKTKEHWRDVKSIEFEEKYFADLPSLIAGTINAMEEMDTLFKKVKGDCE